MAKKTNNKCFDNAWDMAEFEEKCCQRCTKGISFNKKLGRFPQFKCAIQRDYQQQSMGEVTEISQRSYDACKTFPCPFMKAKDEEQHKVIGRHVSPKPTEVLHLDRSQTPINIAEQAEKSIRRREHEVDQSAKAQKEQEEKERKDIQTTIALSKAYDRMMNRNAVVPIGAKTNLARRHATITPELQQHFHEKGEKIKEELDAIVRVYLSGFHIIIQCMLDVGDGVMQDCVREIKSRGKFKMRIKKQINDTQGAFRKVYDRILSVTSEVADLRNVVLDTVNDDVKNDLTMLTYALKAVLDKHNIKDSLFVAQMDTAWVMFEMARMEANVIRNTAKQMLTNVFVREKIPIPVGFYQELSDLFAGKDPNGIARSWQKVSLMIQPQIDEISEEINNDIHVKNAISIIAKKLGNMQKMEDLSNNIIEENPELVEQYKLSHPDWDKITDIAI